MPVVVDTLLTVTLSQLTLTLVHFLALIFLAFVYVYNCIHCIYVVMRFQYVFLK